jgi:HK97 family phage portal protein
MFPAIRDAFRGLREGMGSDPISLRLQSQEPEQRATLRELDEFLDYLQSGGGETWSGVSVTTREALQLTTVWACITVRSKAVGQLPLVTYRVDADGNKEKARGHYLYRLLRRAVNPYMTASRFKKLMETWVCIDGNAYAQLVVNGRGQVTEIRPWHYSKVEVKVEGGEPVYYYKLDGQDPLREPWYNMLHIRGDMSTDGFFGLSPIAHHRQTIGFGLAIRKHGSKFFSNGARLSGLLTLPSDPGPTKVAELREDFNKLHSGDRVFSTAVFPAGTDYKELGINATDAQYIETLQATVPEICRIYGVPPHKVFDLLRSTNNNIEHQDIEWRADYLGPRLVEWEDELNQTLLSDRESESVVIEFLINALMRTDAKSRAEYLTKALGGAPWMKQNEARRVENMNADESEEADRFPVTNNAPGPAGDASAQEG